MAKLYFSVYPNAKIAWSDATAMLVNLWTSAAVAVMMMIVRKCYHSRELLLDWKLS